MAKEVFRRYGSCMMQVQDFKARYFYLNDKDEWVEVDYSEF